MRTITFTTLTIGILFIVFGTVAYFNYESSKDYLPQPAAKYYT